MSSIIVEIGNTHEGSLGIAMSLARMAIDLGAETVKFQMHLAEKESALHENFRVRMSPQDSSRREYWRRINFRDEEWSHLAKYVDGELGKEFLCTPFSKEAAEWLINNVPIKRWKIGSGDATNWQLIDFVMETQLPVIVSTGLVSMEEISLISKRFEKCDAIERLTLLHCVSSYPSSIAEISLNLMLELRQFAPQVGFSDHSGNVNVGIYALTLGADVLEVHFTPHSSFYGPDVSSSLDPQQLRELIQFEKDFRNLKSSMVSKRELFDSAIELRRLFRKGLYWKRSLEAGDIVTIDDFLFLKPVMGLDSVVSDQLISRVLSRSVVSGEAVIAEDFL